MRLLLADPMETEPLDELRVLGVQIVPRPDLTKETLPGALADVDILVVRGTEVSAAAIARAPKLNLIVRAGAGTGGVDVVAASERGIYVANCPGRNAHAVAELVMGLVVAADRRIVDAASDLRGGRWEKGRYAEAPGLWGRRIGIAGLGATGREVLARARAFGLVPTAWSRSLTQAKASRLEVGHAASIERLAATSDVLTVHLPLTPQTRGIVGRSALEALPDGAIVVNAARAELFDTGALIELIPQKKLRVAFDVFPDEPGGNSAPFVSKLVEAGAIGTPHIGASTVQAQRAVAQEIARIVRSYLTEEDVPNVVNIARSPARYTVVLRQLDKVGALANTLSVLKRHGINIEEISNTVFDGARAVCTKLRVQSRPSEACLQEIAAFEETLHVDVVSMPNLA
jgi:D-3-phosphoglycerate dehydrogenase